MKSQSTIIGRVLPGVIPTSFRGFSTFKRNVAYYCRYYSFPLTIVGIFAASIAIVFGVTGIENIKNNNIMKEQAKLYHYAVGSNAKCNTAGDHGSYSNEAPSGWINCKIVSVTKDNYYYKVALFDPTQHKTVYDTLQIQYVSDK